MTGNAFKGDILLHFDFSTNWYELYWPPCWRAHSCPPTWRLKLRFSYGLQNSRFYFLKSVKKSVKRGVRVLRARTSHARSISPQSHSLVSASFQTFCLTARAYLTTQKYRLFRSLEPAVKHAINELTFSLSPLPRNI